MNKAPLRRTAATLLLCLLVATSALPAIADIYNKSVAVNYALQWGGNRRNPNFPAFEQDCTNFVSQALAVGWSSFRYNRNPEYEWFYTSRWNYSRSWTVAHTLFNFIKNTRRGDIIGEGVLSNPGRYNDLEPGDLIFASWGDNGWIDHVYIVTGRDQRGILVTAHTTDRLNDPFWGVMNGSDLGRRGRYYYMRMKTQY